jgi:hypothetical protein
VPTLTRNAPFSLSPDAERFGIGALAVWSCWEPFLVCCVCWLRVERLPVPYFFFNVRTAAGAIMDQEGAWFPDVLTAEREASAAARELVADCIKGGIYILPEAIAVTELSGSEVAIVRFKDVLPHFQRRRS